MQVQSMQLSRAALGIAILFAGLCCSEAKAEFYAGFGAAGELPDRARGITDNADAETVRSALAGYNFTDTLGVEATYSDLGKLSLTGIADGGFRTDGDLWSVALTYSPDTGALRPYPKLGWFNRNESGRATTIAGPVPIDFDDDGPIAELGGRWFVNDSVAVRLGYAWYHFDRGSDGSVGAGIEWHFR
jgi:hypothetical protein